MEENSDIHDIVLTINLPTSYAYATDIWIFSHKKRLVAEPDGKGGITRSYHLSVGNYIVRIVVNGQIQDNSIELAKNTTFTLGTTSSQTQLIAPKLFSSALIGNENIEYESSHEYYTEPAKGISLMETFKDLTTKDRKSGIFIFLRFQDRQKFEDVYGRQDYWDRFNLTTELGRPVTTFPDGCIEDENQFGFNYSPRSGYIGLSGYLSPGLYFLNYTGNNARVVPIYVYENWYTQFFMTVAKEPLFGSIRIFISKHRNYNPADRNHIYIDYCLTKIQNNELELDDELLQKIAHNKYDSPMLGLLGAYIYLLSSETKNDFLFRKIVKNIQNKILKNSKDSPDIWALNLLSYEHFKKTLTNEEKANISGTPMLRIAFDTVRRSAIKYPWLIPENSLNDHVAENQAFDSPYNTFRPFEYKFNFVWTGPSRTGLSVGTPLPPLDVTRPLMRTIEIQAEEVQTLFEIHRKPASKVSLQDSLDQSNPPVLNAIDNSYNYRPSTQYSDSDGQTKLSKVKDKPKKNGELASFIAASILEGNDLTPRELASRLTLPLNTVLRIFKEIHFETSNLEANDDYIKTHPDIELATHRIDSKITLAQNREEIEIVTSGSNYSVMQPEVQVEKVRRLAHGFRRTLFGFSPSFIENSRVNHFGYLFDSRSRIPYTPSNRKLLEDLGLNMLEDSATIQVEDSTVESGYTYFGQFVDHDITLDVDSEIGIEQNARDLINYRTPNLELDSVYGDGPGVDSFLYDQEGVKLLVANTIIGGADDTIPTMPFDLQRNINGKAIIGDPRNDENLFVAQIHMSIIKFHNAVVDAIRLEEPTLTPDKLFPKVQTEVRRHYQWVLMHDYLKKIIGQARVEEVLQNGPTLMPANRKFFMPVEFSVAAYRFGHSQIRDTYRFNQVFSNSEFFWAFMFTGRIVPSDWIINWRSFFTVDGVPAANMARKIDTRVAFSMAQLPGSAPQGSFFATLSSRNLVRSIALRVGTGKAIAKKLGVTPLTEEELLRSPFANPTPNQVLLHQRTVEILQSDGGLLLKKTPLWYYILKEAEILNQGNQLGPVGGSIVGEVFIRLLKQSKDSFLNDPAWRPRFGVINGDPESFKIVDMLRFAGTLDIPGIS